MMKDMPLQGVTPYDPERAEEDLAQRVAEETSSGGDPHLRYEREADEIAKQITEDTGAEGDMIRPPGAKWTRWEARCSKTEGVP
jgi:hypothetical protein